MGENSIYDTLRIITNFSCNQRCKFCYQNKWDDNFIKFSHILNSLVKHGLQDLELKWAFQNVTILGGEPTLHPQLKQIIDYFAVDQGMRSVRLNTNGINFLNKSVQLSTIENLDVLSLDVGLGQIDDLHEDYETNGRKLFLAEHVLNEYPEIKVKFNHIHTNKISENHQKAYFAEFMRAIKRFPKDRILINVCEDINMSESDASNAKRFAELVGADLTDVNKYFHTLTLEGYKIAYFSFYLYGNTDDCVFIWNNGSSKNIIDYFKAVDGLVIRQ